MTEHVTRVYATERVNDGTGFIEKAGIRPGDRLVMDDDFRWEIRTTTSHLVLDGRVWTRFLNKDDTPPADVNVAVLALKDKKADATESRHNPPAGRHVDRDVREHEYVIWRRGRSPRRGNRGTGGPRPHRPGSTRSPSACSTPT
ncbi:hypothetical protein [Streptomyces virginiae]|uniref:hypothetical protein n=1 Tax=Streptomyces virginiae TaxID=1961 RepID=UPI00225B982B|nr:hypothetical protein [Streptomyces virginiae]MCX5273141.1 hypothetical protein [Streptomyces virginiae]